MFPGATVTGWMVILVLSGIGLLHFGWALGLAAGRAAAVPTRDGVPLFRPGRAATILVGIGLWMMSAVVAMRIGALPSAGPESLPNVGCWGIAAIFALRAIGDFRYVGFRKTVKNTRFAELDTKLYAPFCLAISILTAFTALWHNSQH